MNYFKTFVLIFILTSVFVLLGSLVGGMKGALFALVLAAGINLFAFWNSDSIVLKMYNAQIADRNKYQEFYSITEKLVKNANLPMPKLYVMENNVPNAFATGRNPEHSAVAITTGIWELLSKEELSGVIAHELAHIKNRDTLISTVVAVLASAISMIANIMMFTSIFRGSNEDNKGQGIFMALLISILAPLVATIVQMAVSRSREYAADKLGAKICNNPMALARALYKLEDYAKILKRGSQNPASKEAATAHMFIINPFNNVAKDNLFSTHPATQNRVNQLTILAKQMNLNTTIQDFDHSSNHSKITIHVAPDNLVLADKETIKPLDYDVPNNPWR